MTTAVLEPPKTEEQLRRRTEELEGDVEGLLATEEQPAKDPGHAERVRARREGFEAVRELVLSITRSEVWRDHGLARELLLTLEALRDAIDSDPEAADPGWRQREALMRMRVVVKAMIRQIEHREIDRPEVAARYVATALQDAGDGKVAHLLGTTARMVGNYRAGVAEIRKDPDRVSLVGRLVYELSTTMTPRGVALWFEAPREVLGGRTALDAIGESVAAAREPLLALARGGRGQLDVGDAELA